MAIRGIQTSEDLIIRHIKLIPAVIILVITSSCNLGATYNEYIRIPSEGWHADSVKMFTFQIRDTTQVYDIEMNIRHTTDYPWQNFWVFTETTCPDNVIIRDTIQTFLADDTGKWLGKGFGALFHYSFGLKKQYRFTKSGVYQYRLTQGMRDTLLTGISEVGLKIALSSDGKK